MNNSITKEDILFGGVLLHSLLSNEEDYIAHYGRLGMKWYQHIFGEYQGAEKYAKKGETKLAKLKEKLETNKQKSNEVYAKKESYYRDKANNYKTKNKVDRLPDEYINNFSQEADALYAKASNKLRKERIRLRDAKWDLEDKLIDMNKQKEESELMDGYRKSGDTTLNKKEARESAKYIAVAGSKEFEANSYGYNVTSGRFGYLKEKMLYNNSDLNKKYETFVKALEKGFSNPEVLISERDLINSIGDRGNTDSYEFDIGTGTTSGKDMLNYYIINTAKQEALLYRDKSNPFVDQLKEYNEASKEYSKALGNYNREALEKGYAKINFDEEKLENRVEKSKANIKRTIEKTMGKLNINRIQNIVGDSTSEYKVGNLTRCKASDGHILAKAKMLYRSDYTQREIADILGCSLSTVNKALNGTLGADWYEDD